MEAQHLIDIEALVLTNEQVSPRQYLIILDAPALAAAVQPGQFVHMLIPDMPQRILRRPFSVYVADPAKGTLSILYQVIGAGTEHLSGIQAGALCSLIGPIGRGWNPPAGAHPLLVGGGLGAAPLYMLAEAFSRNNTPATVVLGARDASELVCYEAFKALESISVIPATDDGSFGFNGFCTIPAGEQLATGAYDYLAACGPEPVLKIVAGIAAEAQVPCEVSLERRMACGVGACLSCVVDTTAGKQRCCVDGPVFNAAKVVW